MPKLRVHELAKQLNINNKDLIKKINKELGLDINNHMASLDEKHTEQVINMYKEPKQAQPAEKQHDVVQPIKPQDAKPVDNVQHTKPQQERQQRPQEDRQQRPAEERQQRPTDDRQQRDRQRRERPQGDRPQGDRPQSDRPQGDRPQGDRPRGDRPQGDRPQGDRQHHGNRPQGQGDRQHQGNRPQSDRPQSDRTQYQGNRPQSDRPHGDRPHGERQPYQGSRPQSDRPYGDRPQGDRPQPDRQQGERPQGERPPYQGNRPQGERPPYQGNRPQGDRPPYQGNRPQGERPPYQGSRPQGDRPPYQGSRPQGDRPPYQGSRPQGDRPPYQGSRPQGDRPPYQGSRPQGDRPPYQGSRPQGDRPPYQGSRPQGDRPPYQGNRPQGDRPPFAPRGGTGVIDKDKDSQDQKRPVSRQPRQAGDKGKLAQQEKPQKQMQKIQLEKQHQRNQFKSDEPEVNKKILRHAPKNADRPVIEVKPEEPKLITIPAVITLKELAEAMNKPGAELVKTLMKRGMMVNVNQEVDFETAVSVAEEYNFLVEEKVEVDIFEEAFAEEPDNEEDMTSRPPVVVVMGHVDHGKTSLLDAIRSSHVASAEAGGITQHIGAYTVSIDGKLITFLDTPGHEAFTAMRMRGAQVTDVAILVVDANDGVMPQTIEAINHAKAANVEIIVAINKIDKPSANPDRVKQELLEHGLVAEDYGGETICVPVSAHQRIGIEQLLEMIILVSEMKDLKANPHKNARGTIIEALLDKGRGAVARVLVQDGTLNVGDPIVAGSIYGKIRAMMDDKGKRVKKAGPGIPVEILGLPDVPQAGDMFYVARNERQARQVAESHFAKGRIEMIKATPQKVSLDDLFTQIKAGNIKDLNIVIKADVQGSVEALRTSLEKLTNDEVRIRTIHGGVGAITESDVMLASASTAIIIGFNVRPEPSARSVATEQQVDIRLYRVIYNAIEDIEAAIKGMLDPVFNEKVLGRAQIRQLFKVSAVGTIGGAYVTDGKITRNAKVRVIRDGIVIFDGELDTLRRFKDDVKEVNTGYECGILVSRYNDIRENDIIEAYVMEEVQR